MSIKTRLAKLEGKVPPVEQEIIVKIINPTPDPDGTRHYGDGSIVEPWVLERMNRDGGKPFITHDPRTPRS